MSEVQIPWDDIQPMPKTEQFISPSRRVTEKQGVWHTGWWSKRSSVWALSLSGDKTGACK